MATSCRANQWGGSLYIVYNVYDVMKLYIVYNVFDVMKLLMTGLFHGFSGVHLVLSPIKYRLVTNQLRMAMRDDLRHTNEF